MGPLAIYNLIYFLLYVVIYTMNIYKILNKIKNKFLLRPLKLLFNFISLFIVIVD